MEAQYQDEFYKSWSWPSLNMEQEKDGSISIFLPRNGVWSFSVMVTDLQNIRVAFHSQVVCDGSSFLWLYYSWLPYWTCSGSTSRYIYTPTTINDLYRSSHNVDLQKLYHVVFSDDFEKVSILSSALVTVTTSLWITVRDPKRAVSRPLRIDYTKPVCQGKRLLWVKRRRMGRWKKNPMGLLTLRWVQKCTHRRRISMEWKGF